MKSSKQRTDDLGLAGLIAVVIGLLIGAAITFAVGALKGLINLVFKRRREKVQEAKAFAPTVTSVGRSYENYVPSQPRRTEFPGVGFLTIWAYQDRGEVLAQLSVTDSQVARKVGAKRVPLERLSWAKGVSLDVVEDAAIAKAQSLLARKGVRVNRSDTGADLVQAQPTAATREAAPAPAAQQIERSPAKPYVHMPKSGKKHVAGVLRFAGVAPLVGENGRTTNHVAADVEVPGVGVERVWGVDLTRALQEADAKVGDMIEIAVTGRSAVQLPNGGTGNKKHFHVKKVA